jgi:hypothetical protein
MGRTPLQLPAAEPPSPPVVSTGQFELYEGSRVRARESLQAFLLRVIDRCQQGFGTANTLGFLPRTSIANKLKYYKEATVHPQLAARLPGRLSWAQGVHTRVEASGVRPDTGGIRPRTQHPRDKFGPGMVFVVNTVLAWLMFSIDVRNAMLK